MYQFHPSISKWAVLFAVATISTSGPTRGVEVDWPTFQQNAQRNAFVEGELDPRSLQMEWSTREANSPQPAWHGPAKWDAYANLRGLHSMRNYDPVFHVIAVGDYVYFGSSVEQTVTCLHAVDGTQQWKFFTEGPVRITPAYVDGKIFFGSDDGFAYCLDAMDGSLIWKVCPSDPDRYVVNNGNFIPLWPIRSGVTVDQGTAYFAASMLPWRKTFLCAVDAETGQRTSDKHFVLEHEELTLEGPLALSQDILIAPQGRVPPVLFARTTGEKLGSLEGGGGAMVVVAGDEVLHGPGNRDGWLVSSNAKSRDRLATHRHARAVVVADGITYLLTHGSLLALDQETKETLWQVRCDEPLSLIGVGNHLLVGFTDGVAAYDRGDGRQVWSYDVDGRAYGLVFAQNRLLVSTDTGTTYAFSSLGQGFSQPLAKNPETGVGSVRADDPTLVGHWLFQRPFVDRSVSLAQPLAGGMPAMIHGPVRLERVGTRQAVALTGGETTLPITDNHASAQLPETDMTAEAWVRIDSPLPWGGVASAIQDNDDDEHGWVLGYRNARFMFGLAASGGEEGLTYLTAEEDFSLKSWHHVVGTYDGGEMRLFVDGQLVSTSDAQGGQIDYPTKTFFELGALRDDDEYHRMTGQLHEVRIYDRALPPFEIEQHFQLRAKDFQPQRDKPDAAELNLVEAGPVLQFSAAGEAVVRWQTREAMPTRLTYRLEGDELTVGHDTLTTSHEARLSGLRRNRTYYYSIKLVQDGRTITTPEYECDTFFDYSLPTTASVGALNAEDGFQELAARIIKRSGVDRGLCIDLGLTDGRLAEELVRQSDLRVIGVSTDADLVARVRSRLARLGLYGSRVSVLHVVDLDDLALTSHAANLLVAEAGLEDSMLPVGSSVASRMLAGGGVAVLSVKQDEGPAARGLGDRSNAWVGDQSDILEIDLDMNLGNGDLGGGGWASVRRADLDGAGEWSHAYGRADNSAYGGESLSGARARDELAVQWIGRPGPRYQSDRSGRKSTPLATGGRLFLQGLHRIVAVDAFNGSVLWSLETPDFLRFNMPRDCSNWCADRENVFAAIRNRCWILDAKTGDVSAMLPVSEQGLNDGPYEWGYAATVGDLLLGSAEKQGASWTDYWGGAGWYDSPSGEATFKVCSDRLFAVEKDTNQTRWEYDGLILNSTITADGQSISFVECRNSAITNAEARRIGDAGLWEEIYLVSLDVETGKMKWEIPLETVQGDVAISMALGSGHLVIVTSSLAGPAFHVHAYDVKNGERKWNCEVPWGKNTNDHGTHLSRPAIVGNRLIVRPSVIDLETGETSQLSMPVSGCGTYACSQEAVFFRAWSGQDFAMWDLADGNYTRWSRLRPDCWLSSIPAAGLLLSPEGGGGCSCGKWMETSLAFIPKSLLLAADTSSDDEAE